MHRLDKFGALASTTFAKIQDLRVFKEAQDLFWGAFSGTTKRMAARAVIHSLIMFVAAVVVSILIGTYDEFISCSDLVVSNVQKQCAAFAPRSFVLFIPALLILFLGSYISTQFCREKLFQSSGFETVLILFYSSLSLSFVGIRGGLYILLLVFAFFCMFMGYRFAYWKKFQPRDSTK